MIVTPFSLITSNFSSFNFLLQQHFVSLSLCCVTFPFFSVYLFDHLSASHYRTMTAEMYNYDGIFLEDLLQRSTKDFTLYSMIQDKTKTKCGNPCTCTYTHLHKHTYPLPSHSPPNPYSRESEREKERAQQQRRIQICKKICTCSYHQHCTRHKLTLLNMFALESMDPLCWRAADAEIKVVELKGSPFKTWGRSLYSHTCYTYYQGFLPC